MKTLATLVALSQLGFFADLCKVGSVEQKKTAVGNRPSVANRTACRLT